MPNLESPNLALPNGMHLNALSAQGVLDWVQQVLAWLNQYHPDWTLVQADASALLKLCTDAIADGRLSFRELSQILKAAIKLSDDLTAKLQR